MFEPEFPSFQPIIDLIANLAIEFLSRPRFSSPCRCPTFGLVVAGDRWWFELRLAVGSIVQAQPSERRFGLQRRPFLCLIFIDGSIASSLPTVVLLRGHDHDFMR